jgi:cystathionine beta-lyase
MKSFFDAVIRRDNTNSVKWNPKIYKDMFDGCEDLLPLWVADMDFRVSSGITERLQEVLDHAIFGYTCRDDEYFEAVKRWNKVKHNFDIEKDEIIFTPGVVPAINQAILSFTEKGDSILIQPPVYPPFQRSVLTNGRKIVKNPLVEVKRGKYEIDFDDMEKKIVENDVKMLIFCSPHNPVGRVWTPEELKKVDELCRKYNVLVLSDEIHSDITFGENQHKSFSTISPEAAQNSITCTSVSKTFNLAGLRVSNIIIKNPELREKFRQTQAELAVEEPNSFAIAGVKGAYLESDEWYAEMKNYLAENIEYALEYINENLPKVKVNKPEGTYLLWLDFRDYNLTTEELKKIFEEDIKVAVNFGNNFGEEGAGFIRLNIACPNSILKEALKRINEIFRNK